MNILVLYNETQTFTSTVYEHLDSFARFSRNRVFFAHQDLRRNPATDLHLFDAVIIHYSVRLPFDQISEPTARALSSYSGLKVVFIQDEYDHTRRTWHWIQRLGVRLVFSSVPDASMARIYPPAEFPGVRFVSNLTGYAPEALAAVGNRLPPSQRPLKIGYRGRALPIRYGALGQEKIEIGRMVRAFCETANVAHDIAWQEADRLYGDQWYDFITSCRAVLGTESGSNVFDWDGSLQAQITAYKGQRPRATDPEIYTEVIAPLEIPNVMNQVSPRIFEAIACRTVMVLFEGSYSGVVVPDRHFIPLRKDGTNLDEVIERLRDDAAVDMMVELAFAEVLGGGKYSYAAFMQLVDDEIEASALQRSAVEGRQVFRPSDEVPMIMRSHPHRYQLPRRSAFSRYAGTVGRVVPKRVKDSIRYRLGLLLSGD